MLKAIVLSCFVAFATCQVVGGWTKRDVTDDDVVAAANHAAKALSNSLSSGIFAGKFHHRLAKLDKAESQIVAGTNYRMIVTIGETECRKDEVEYEDALDCEFREGVDTYKKCKIVVFKNLDGEHKLSSSGCIIPR